MHGPNFLNIELTSRCNKSCWMCGRRKMERNHPELCDWGDMPYEMVEEIASQLSGQNVIQFHNNGEALLYPRLGDALRIFRGHIRCFNTNGKLLLDKASEIIGNLETLTISVIENDPEGDAQYDAVQRFLDLKRERGAECKPRMVYRLLGDVDHRERWERLPGVIATRILHAPEGSRNYRKAPTVPEIGICLDLLTHMAIDRYGNISLCVRFDPHGYLRVGHVNTTGLDGAWNSEKRKFYVKQHIEGMRDKLPGCSECDYWGCPTSP